ncbi:MAG: VWA domain-containing protein [Acidobacteria bacterium]|nr:VWA domain-containing protein [Acidobacteriota bacterium]
MKRISSRISFLVLFALASLMSGSALSFSGGSDPDFYKESSKKKTLEMVFVLDTTGSMGGLIEGAKQKIWSIVNGVMSGKEKANVKIGLVAYRDNGDLYVTKVLPLTDDLDKVYTTLMAYEAGGGGDTPENVRRALADGVHKVEWSKKGKNISQIIFLVGDAPPHNDYPQEPDVLETTAKAVSQNMIVNTIQCGNLNGTKEIWQEIARRGEGKYFAIAQDGGVQAISTPYDKELSELGSKIGGTYLAYGGGAGEAGRQFRLNKMEEQASTEVSVSAAAPKVAQADRAVNKAINSRAYANDLLQEIENGRITLKDVKKEDLPDELKSLSAVELEKEVQKRITDRKELRAKILELSKKRDAYIKAERAKIGKQDGFDSAVEEALLEQMARP